MVIPFVSHRSYFTLAAIFSPKKTLHHLLGYFSLEGNKLMVKGANQCVRRITHIYLRGCLSRYISIHFLKKITGLLHKRIIWFISPIILPVIPLYPENP